MGAPGAPYPTFGPFAASTTRRSGFGSQVVDGSSQREAGLTPQAAGEVNRGAAVLSVAAASLLVALKGGAWIASGSVAMLASLADSMLDLVASLFTYFAVRFAATPPDREHRFGHGKAEAFAGLFQAGLVAVSGTLIAVEAVRRIADPQPVERAGLAIVVMMISIVVTGALIVYQSRAVAQTGSVAVKGDRAHYAADLGANVAVMLGIGAAAILQWTWADAMAGCWSPHGSAGARGRWRASPPTSSWTANCRMTRAKRSGRSRSPAATSLAFTACAPAHRGRYSTSSSMPTSIRTCRSNVRTKSSSPPKRASVRRSPRLTC